MTRALAIAVLVALAAPAHAQTGPEPEIGEERPFLEQWADEMMRGLVEEISPEIERLMREIGPELDDLFAEVIPRLKELADLVGGIGLYEMPEMLPNGDIIIRRKPDAPPVRIDPESNAPIEL